MRRFIETLPLVLFVLFGALASFTATAFAAGAVAPAEDSLLDLARPIYEQVMAGHYIAAVALALVLAVAAAKRYAPGRAASFLHSDVGGALGTFLMALGGALATATLGGAPWHWAMLSTSGMVAFTAAGGYALAKKLVAPLLQKFADGHPWSAPVLKLVLWIFDKPSAVQDAEHAGDAAVAAKPAAGTAAVVGPATEVK